jgi:tetratricopeptide (TPR) repeat protein
VTRPGGHRQGAQRAGVILPWLAVFACARPSAPPAPIPLQVEIAGCSALLADSRCELPPAGGPLRLWIAAPAGATLSVGTDRAAQWSGPAVAEGSLHELKVEPSASSLRVTARAGDSEAVWTAALLPPVAPPALQEANKLREAGDLEGAVKRLDALDPGDEGPVSALVLSARARIELRRGKLEEAAALFRRSVRMHAALGRVSNANDDATALVFALVHHLHGFTEARELLDEASTRLAAHPEGRARLPYYRGLLSAATGDLRTALAQHRVAAREAKRLGIKRLASNAHQAIAGVNLRLGRWSEARAELELAEAHGYPFNACDQVDLLSNLACIGLRQEESVAATPPADGGTAPSPQQPIEQLREALTRFDPGAPQRCPDLQAHVNLKVNLALSALQAGDAAEGRRQLTEARVLLPSPGPRLALWWIELEGKLALEEKKPAAALEHFDRLLQLARASTSPEDQWRAHTGRGKALLALGQLAPAREAFAQSEAVLDDPGFAIPLLEGRDSYLDDKEESARNLVALLVKEGKPGEALAVVRWARSRVLAALHRANYLESLSPSDRARWESAIGSYQKARAQLDAAAADDWKLPARALAEARLARRDRELQLRQTLDRAYSLFGQGGVRPQTPPAPAEGELVLAYFPVPRGWVGLSATATETRARSLTLPAREAGSEAWSAALLSPFAAELGKAKQLRLLPHGGLPPLDFHALPWRAGVLIDAVPVVYPLDLGTRPGSPSSAEERERTLVVSDPRGDLPASREEAAAVVARLGKAQLLQGEQATSASVARGLAAADLFHFAGHGAFGQDLESALPLAAGGRLSVSDILALPRVPEQVILSGCETGRAGQRSAVAGLGLAQAFVAAGSRSAVASVRPVTDGLAARLSLKFHAAEGASAAERLRLAQLALRAETPEEDWAAFRVIVP